MAKPVELSTITPRHLWIDLHVTQGRTQAASDLGARVLASIDTEHFTNFGEDNQVANRHGEIASIVHKTSLAVFKRAEDWQVAGPYLIRAAQVAADHYPIADTLAMATAIGDYWDPVYGLESAQRICAADLAKLYEILSALTGNEELYGLAHGLKTILSETTVPSNDHERFDLIGIIDKPTTFYATARAAYEQFLKNYGYDSPVESVDQIVTVSSKMFGRAFAEKDWRTLRLCTQMLRIALMKQPHNWRFIAKEVAKNFSLKQKSHIVDEKLSSWAVTARSSEELLVVINQLESMTYLGLGHGEAVELQSS